LRVETGSPVNYPALRWRGNALANFDGRRWTSAERAAETLTANSDGWIALREKPQPGEARGEILQFTVLQEPMASDALFVAGTMLAIRGSFTGEAGGMGHRRNYLYRDFSGSLINPFHNFVSVRYTGISQLPALNRAQLEAAGTDYPPGITDVYLQLPEIDRRIPELARSATQHAVTPYDKAAALEVFLKTKFSYTLDLAGNPGKDPLAHFLFETRAGHCEYFASSMTVMLRTLGIPAREVNGFLPGEFNELGGDYIVRASDAHSWVEAYFPGSGWMVFDPTPDAPVVSATLFSRLSQLTDWAELTWNDWVISYDFAHQTVLAQTFQSKSHNWRELGAAWFAEKQWRMKDRLTRWQLRHGAFSFVLPLLLVALLVALRYGWIEQLLRKLQIALVLRGRNAGAASSQIASRMYVEMLQLMGRHGYARTETQTPFEFAAAVNKPVLRPMVQEFTQLYSIARFGGAVCDLTRLQELLVTIRGELRAR
jgi:transglutaminase-like putative cysteine protease